MKKKDYQVVSRSDRRALAEFLSQEGQLLLPMLELIEQAELAVDELIDVAGRVSRWRDGSRVLRWVATAWLTTEKSFRRIMGHPQLWMLAAYLDDPPETEKFAQQRKVG